MIPKGLTVDSDTIGFIGLGRMGAAMTTRLIEHGITVHAADVDEQARNNVAELGVHTHGSIGELVAALPTPSVVWVMVPAQFVDVVLDELTSHVVEQSIIIDGGNSDYRHSRRRYKTLKRQDLHFIDCGTSGGVEGARNGASLMIGGDEEVFQTIEPLCKILAAKNAYARVGNFGAGHFVKAVHNGIEYGMMGALAEGMSLLHDYKSEFGLDIEGVLNPYERESIISSRLMSWLAEGVRDGTVTHMEGTVPVGETEAKMKHLTDIGDMKVLKAALLQRAESREEASTVGLYTALLRHKFGGHSIVKKEDK